MKQTLVVYAFAVMLLPSLADAYEPSAVTGGGKVAGTVRFEGKAPEPAAIEIVKDPQYCGKVPLKAEDLLVSAAKGLRNVIVYLQGVDKGKPLSAGSAMIDNSHCRYEPHVQALAVGTELSVRNSDPILHNTHIRLPKSDVFNYGLPVKDQVVKKKLTRTGLMKVGCDAGHTWMSAYIAVFDHPYFAVTDEEGHFTMEDVPPGRYTVVLWHEKLGKKKAEVEVTPGGAATVTVSYP